jgi:peptidoglycan/xylan/chitin deacetylase (PgdA/CDA1 family)
MRISLLGTFTVLALLAGSAPAREPIPDKLVVLTFDDSSKSHYTVARPLLKKLGFGATFFITEGFDFPTNKRDYMTWEEIAQLHRDGFEIGNHTRDHQGVTRETLRDLAAQVRGINERCRAHGIPVPVSFAYPGNAIEPGALPILRDLGIRFARRGGSPEYPYREGRGFAYEPGRDHPLLLPSAGDARPAWTLKDFRRAVEQARNRRIAVLQFHGVPDTAHDWVNSSKGQFEIYMNHLADNRYKVIAMRDLARYVDPDALPKDPQAVIEARQALVSAEARRDAPAPRGYDLVASGPSAGGYAAFPDICRTRTGELICVFYSGYGHVSKPTKDWPRGGRVLAVRSRDNGKTWSDPVALADTIHDDRDPHIAPLRDGTLICNWFVAAHPEHPLPGNRPIAVFLARSADHGKTWSEPVELKIDSTDWFACSAPVRELPDGSLILGLYTENAKANRVFGATIRSDDGGKSWKDLALIGEGSGLYLDAETDVIRLRDGALLAALRSSKTDLYLARSTDGGKSWSKVRSAGFKGHCPHFLRHSSGTILLAHRLPATALHWSFDEGSTWQGPLQIDRVSGAYPSCVELPDGTVYCVYYEEGEGSSIRGARLKVTRSGVRLLADK